MSLFKLELLTKERICSQSKFFPLREVPCGMGNHFYHTMCAPLSITIFITHVPYGSYANDECCPLLFLSAHVLR